MTAQTTDVYSGNLRPESSDEIDLRRYLLVLWRWWREIFAIAIFAGALAGAAILLLNLNKTPEYTASADIVIARLSSNIELDDRVSTLMGTVQTDTNSWRTSLLQLASSSVVANAVLADLKGQLPATLQTPEALVEVIQSDVPLSPDERYASNIIRIRAVTTDAGLSTLIANHWALHLVDYINGLYGEVPESMIESVTAERDQALATYQSAEIEYEEFVANNQIDGLRRQIQAKSTLREQIMVSYTRMVTSVVTTEYNARMALYDTLAKAPIAHAAALVAAQSAGSVQALNELYASHTTAVAQLNQARNMERSLVEGGEAAAKSNVAALQLLKLSVFSALQSDEALPSAISLSSSTQAIEMSLDEQLIDVRALVAVLDASVTQLESDITRRAESTMLGADLTTVGGLDNTLNLPTAIGETSLFTNAYAQLLSPDGILNQLPVELDSTISNAHETLLATLESEIRTLQSTITAQESQQQQLIHRRDLAWTTYDTVGNKLLELSLLRSSANSEVRVGNPAMTPLSPMPRTGLVLPVAAVTVFGFFLAVILALIIDTLGGVPFFARRATSPLIQ